MRAGRRRRRPRSRRASSRHRPRPCRRPRTSRSRCFPTARSARRGRRGPARECRRPAPCRSAASDRGPPSPRSRFRRAPGAPAAPASAGTAKLAPSPPNTKGNSRPAERVGHRDDHRGAGHVHRLVAVLGDGLGRLHHVGHADHPVAGQRAEQRRVHHLGEVAKQRQACVEVVGRVGRSQRRFAFAPRQDCGLFQIEVALQPAPRFVGDLAVAQQLVEEVALGRDQFQPDVVARADERRSPSSRSLGMSRSRWSWRALRNVDDLGAELALAGELLRDAAATRGSPRCARQARPPARAGARPCRARPTPSQRITAGSIRPWPTSVMMMTPKVTNRIRSRCGNGAPLAMRQRNGERRGERDHAAHAGEGEHERLLPRRRRIASRERRDEPARQIGRRKHPDEARDDDDRRR